MSSNMTAIPTVTHLLTSTVPSITENFRHKRQIWQDYYYDSYYGYGFHWSRIILIILIIMAIFLCCLVPCICALGIWFAGWFGLRSHVTPKSYPTGTNVYAQQQPAPPQRVPQIPDSTPVGPENSRQCRDSYVYEEKRSDRYYNRPSSPRPNDYRQHFTSSRL